MAHKTDTIRTEETFDLVLRHPDIVDMMNDPQVLIDDGNVQPTQEFQLVLRKQNGGEIILKDMTPNDKLIIRFKKITVTSANTNFIDIDVK
jgi:hypothetical protein